MNTDEHGEAINGEKTYQRIAKDLQDEQDSVLVGWTDENMTHFDVLFVLNAQQRGINIHGGIKPDKDLFVAIMRKGAFAFSVTGPELHQGYIAEKLGLINQSKTTKKLADLLNGVKSNLV